MRANARHFFSAINSPLLILPAVLPRARGEEQQKEEEKRKRRREKKRIGLRVIFKMGGGTNDGDLEEEEEEDWDEQDWARYQVIRDWRPPPPTSVHQSPSKRRSRRQPKYQDKHGKCC